MKQTILTLLLLLGLSMTVQAGETPVRIAIIDTGISSDALTMAQIAQGENYILPNSDTEDRHGHGTAVAAIIAQHTTAELVPLVYYDKSESGFSYKSNLTMLADIIRDAVDIYHCDIINLSSGAGTDNPNLRDAIAYAEQKGVLVVAAAGNDGNSALYYPAVYPTVLCVGSANPDGTDRASFSNYFDGVDILAQGVNVPTVNLDGTPRTVTGTSFSTAVITGMAAELLREFPNLTAYQLRNILQDSATDLGVMGLDVQTGHGLIHFASAHEMAKKTTPFPFDDVPDDAYFHAPVEWALQSGITGGTSATEFSPNGICTRGQTVTFLWRAVGSPAPRLTHNPFNDVCEDDYFYDAVLWAIEKGVTDGTSETTFSPDANCTQAEVTTLLWRALDRPNAGSPSALASSLGEHYYTDAVAWADVSNLYEKAQVQFTPKSDATRAHIVTYLYCHRR